MLTELKISSVIASLGAFTTTEFCEKLKELEIDLGDLFAEDPNETTIVIEKICKGLIKLFTVKTKTIENLEWLLSPIKKESGADSLRQLLRETIEVLKKRLPIPEKNIRNETDRLTRI